MLRLVQFDNGRYGLQNTWTGIVLPKSFRTQWGAIRHSRKLRNKLEKRVASIQRILDKRGTTR